METTTNTTRKVALGDIRVSDSLYRRDTVRSPRGKGRWAFSIGNTEAYDDVAKAFFTDYMSYTEAVKVAKKEAQKRGAETIYVLP